MSYANSEEATRKLQKLEIIGKIDSDILSDSITTADELVDAKLVDISIPNPPPNPITKAATLLAQAEYLDNIAVNRKDSRHPTALAWEDKAYRILEGWIKEDQKNRDPTGKYIRNNSSTHRPFRGNKLHRLNRRWR